MNETANRLKAAREAAGFANASECATRFGWKYATYAGHENGHRGIKLDTLKKYAAAFKVDVSWLLSGGSAPPKETPQIPPPTGFSEPEVRPFQPRNAAEGQMILSTLSALAPGSRHTQIYLAQRAFSIFSILSGDLLLIGTPKAVLDGDIVIANLSSHDGQDVQTVVRQRIGDLLVPPPYEKTDRNMAYDVGILGTVLAIVRTARPQGE